MEYKKIHKIEKIHLKEILANDFNIPAENIPDAFLEGMEKIVQMRKIPDEYIKIHLEIPPSSQDKTLFLIPRTYYHINVRKATWTVFGLILDLLLTKGVTSTILASLGVIGQIIGKLYTENGEVCNYYQAYVLNKEIDERDIFNRINGKECPYHEFKCIYKHNNRCSIKISALEQNFDRLKEVGAIRKTKSNKYSVEL